jgi:hypothetical protein
VAVCLDYLLVERFIGVAHKLLFHFVNGVFYDILKFNDIYLVRVNTLDSRQRSIILSDRINPPSLKPQLWRGKQDCLDLFISWLPDEAAKTQSRFQREKGPGKNECLVLQRHILA